MTSRRTLLAGLAALTVPLPARAAEPSVLATALAGTATPGMAAMVIRDFRAEPEQVAGVRRLGDAKAAARGARWHLGSNGKAMTATLVARLVEREALAWDRPLEKMLPALAAGMRPEYRAVTLPDLLSHHASLPENHDDTAYFNTFFTDRASMTAQRLRYIGTALGDAPIGPVRGEPSYSNTGLLIAAACAEQATGQAFESLIAKEVFRPLGIKSFSFDQHGGRAEPCGHVEGRAADRPFDANPKMFAPAGAMRMSLGDWSRFCIDQMQGEHGRGRLLKAEGYRFLHAPQGSGGARGWALGWGAADRAAGRKGPALTHSGSDGNWYALVILFPQTGNGVLVAANAADSMGGDKASLAALRALAATVAEPAPPAA
ncbi:MAG: serine hydrolase domain-containing protein [Phenylobacterium sp.]|uniref:serine hydrolase domain-containing protein n=1 Tax=Phenylobacterium sp. TaxID=1871053 RepID=UPI0027335A1D|nr:serine hydrolase domain-containing protein [Phenylobacterium sp.]MDP3748027.1 serine hydrolase domain-containing protein [Phenylobacterium sp.]